jgi:hypothetical protein
MGTQYSIWPVSNMNTFMASAHLALGPFLLVDLNEKTIPDTLGEISGAVIPMRQAGSRRLHQRVELSPVPSRFPPRFFRTIVLAMPIGPRGWSGPARAFWRFLAA